jgi:hypothetical protein
MTAHEAQTMAISRYKLYQRARVSARLDFPGSVTYHADVVVDLVRHGGWGSFETRIDGKATEAGSMAWNTVKVFTAPTKPGPDGTFPAVDAWFGRRIDRSNGFDNFLLTLLLLGADRPENPQLLRQSAAQVMRTDRIGGVPVTVFSGPQAQTSADTPATTANRTPTDRPRASSRLRFWVDGQGGIRRFQAYYGAPDGLPAQLTLGGPGTAPDIPDTIRHLFTLGQKP